MFKIIKKGNGNFWHNFNNGSKEVNLSNWEIVLDSINQTVSLQMLNGANVPINSVAIADVIVIDETDVSLEETFGSVSALRTRLIELNYTPYIVLNGFVPEAPIDGLTYGRKDAEWVEVSGGGSVGTLQQVTDNGNTTTNAIEVSNHIKASEFRSSADDITFADGSGNPIFFFASTGANQANFDKALLTADRNYSLPDASGTIALTSNIPTVDATPTDGSSNTVSSNGVFDALANKVDANAPITGTIKTKITYDSKGLVTSGADATTADISDSTNKRYVTDAQLVVIGNTSGTNTGDNATNSQYSGLATSKQDVLTDVNFGSFSTALTAKTTPVDADTINIVDSADSNKSKKVSFTNLKAFLKTYFDGLYLVPNITITTSTSIDTDTTGSGYGQHGRNTKISNGANAINLTVQTSSNADFCASYTKIGTSNITFIAGSGATLTQLSGTAVLSGQVGSTACLTRNGNIYYLQINNY